VDVTIDVPSGRVVASVSVLGGAVEQVGFRNVPARVVARRGRAGDVAIDVAWGGALYAAAFLREFVGDGISWAHLDIAGPAFIERSRGDYLWQPGGTGYGVRLIAELGTRLAA